MPVAPRRTPVALARRSHPPYPPAVLRTHPRLGDAVPAAPAAERETKENSCTTRQLRHGDGGYRRHQPEGRKEMSNPFVKAALNIIKNHNQPLALADVVSELAAVEPMLSPFNLQRVAAEAAE